MPLDSPCASLVHTHHNLTLIHGACSVMSKQVRPRIRGRLTRQQEAGEQTAAPTESVKGSRKGVAASQDAAGVAQAANGTGRSARQGPGAAEPGASPAAGGKSKAAATAALPGSPNKRKRPADDTQRAAQPAAAEGRSKGSKAARRAAVPMGAAGSAAAAAGGGVAQLQQGADLDSDSEADELAPRANDEQRGFLEEVRLHLPPRV